MRKLERKLEENKIKEEKEAQDLEAMVQHVEQNLQLMTVSVGICHSSRSLCGSCVAPFLFLPPPGAREAEVIPSPM